MLASLVGQFWYIIQNKDYYIAMVFYRIDAALLLSEIKWLLPTLCGFISVGVRNIKILYIEGILPKGPYLPCVSMAGSVLLAGYPRYMHRKLHNRFLTTNIYIYIYIRINAEVLKWAVVYMMNLSFACQFNFMLAWQVVTPTDFSYLTKSKGSHAWKWRLYAIDFHSQRIVYECEVLHN